MAEQALGDKQRVFGIVADHATPENQSMPPLSLVWARHPMTGQSFSGQLQCVADCRTDQQPTPPESRFISLMGNRWRGNHAIAAGGQ
jgi:hypothetical protein